MEQVKLVYFSVDRCGYHQHGDAVRAFGGLGETLAEIKAWIQGKTIRQTKAFDPEPDDDLFPVYIYDCAIDPVSGDALVVTWNETPTADGKVAAAAGDDIVGDVAISLVGVPPNSIPGFPCFFLFMPSRSAVINLRFDGQTHGGQPGMTRYIQEFMSRYSSHVVMQQGPDEVQIKAYVENPGDQPNGAFPCYRTRQMRVPGKVEWLKERVSDIRKMIRKDDLTAGGGGPTRGTIWGWFGIANPITPTTDRRLRFNFEIDCALTAEQLESLVQFEAGEQDFRKDIGFKLKGGNEIHWLSHALVKQELEVDVTRSNEGTVPATDLLAALSNRRNAILSVMPNA